MSENTLNRSIETKLAELGTSPNEIGTVEMIVSRPAVGERQILEEAELDTTVGLVGDTWHIRPSRHTEDGSAHPDMQVTLMNSRTIAAIAEDKAAWALAGDQFYVDYDISAENLPIGQRFMLGTAILEISEFPHTGCGKFNERFGSEATRFVNSKEGRALRRRGVNAKVVQAGLVRLGDNIQKVDN